MRRTRLSALIAVGSLLLLLPLTAAVAQEGEWWTTGSMDDWSPRLRRVAARETLRGAASLGSSEAQSRLEKVVYALDSTLTEGFWRGDGRLSPWGSEYFATEKRIFRELEAGLSTGLFEGSQEQAVLLAVGYLLSADTELVQRGVDGTEDVLASLDCSEDQAVLEAEERLREPHNRLHEWFENCSKVADKLERQHDALAAAFSAMGSERRLDAVDRLSLSWKRSNKAERKYLASGDEAIEMVDRLARAIEDQGCVEASDAEPRMCSEARERLEEARRKLQRALGRPQDDARVIQWYWGAWKIAWSALWQDLPVGAGYIEAPADPRGSGT